MTANPTATAETENHADVKLYNEFASPVKVGGSDSTWVGVVVAVLLLIPSMVVGVSLQPEEHGTSVSVWDPGSLVSVMVGTDPVPVTYDGSYVYVTFGYG